MELEPHTSRDRVLAPAPGLSAALFIAFLGMGILATQPLDPWSSTRLPGNSDALLNAWALNQVCGSFSNPANILRGNMFFPDSASLLYSEPLIGVGVQSLPVCLLGLDHVALFNASYVLLLAMSALGAFVLAREITGSAPAALVAGTVFAFTSANYDSAARLQIVASQWTPFCFLYLIRFCKGGKSRDALLLGGAFGMQALSCTYYEIFLALLLVLALPLWIELAGGLAAARQRLAGVGMAVAVSAALVLPLNLAQRRHLDPVLATRPQAQEVTLSFFTDVLPTNLIYGGILGRARVAYDALYFPGVVPLTLALVLVAGVLHQKRRAGTRTGLKALILVGVAAFLFALGARISTWWGEFPGPLSLFTALPGLGQARVPSRFLMFSRLALAIVAAAGAHRLLGRLRRGQWAAASALALACFAEHWSAPLDTWVVPARNELPGVYSWLQQEGPSVGPVLEFPPALQRLRREEAAWLHTAAFHGIPMANGYSSFRPAWLEFVMEASLRFPDERLLSILRQIGVRTIILHPRPRGLPEVDEAAQALLDYAGRHPEELSLIKSFSDSRHWDGLWARLGDERVFAIAQGANPPMPQAGALIDRTGWTCRSTEANCELTLDGDAATRLEGRAAQGPGQSLKIRFPGLMTIESVAIHLGRFPEAFPRDPVIRVMKGEEWVAVDARLDVERFLSDMMAGSANPAMRWRFPETSTSGFEIRLRSGGHGFRELVVPEVSAFAPISPAPSPDPPLRPEPSTQTRPR